jgi:hypothetical protein
MSGKPPEEDGMGSAGTRSSRGRFAGRRRIRRIGIGLGCALLLGGCSGGSDGDSQGAATVADGAYRLLATSASQEPDATVSLQITGDALVLTQGSDTVEGTLGQPVGTEYMLCPPDGRGSPRPLDTPVEVGGVALANPALFGDCGQTRPVRVTLVDLSATTDQTFPFRNWAEFCDTRDPDC